jgi:6-phosphogluconolactonase
MTIKEFVSHDHLFQALACDVLNILPRGFDPLNDPFSLILSGGRSPVNLHRLLVEQSISLKTDWDNISFFFSDERCVPPDNELSNYAMARHTLFSPLGLSENKVYRIKGELLPDEAAEKYHKQADDYLKKNPCFELALLGMGPDGHTASLFPRSPALDVQDRFAASAGRGPEGKERVTLTFKALNASRRVWVMVTGKDKKETLDKAFETVSSFRDFPIKAINPLEELIFYYSP